MSPNVRTVHALCTYHVVTYLDDLFSLYCRRQNKVYVPFHPNELCTFCIQKKICNGTKGNNIKLAKRRKKQNVLIRMYYIKVQNDYLDTPL